MSVRRTHIRRDMAGFATSIFNTVQSAGAAITETDLVHKLRGSAFCEPADGRFWSFGMYDFRAVLGTLVADGVLTETVGQQRGGGVETRYALGYGRCPECGGHLTVLTRPVDGRIQTHQTVIACDRCEYAKEQ